MRSEDVRIGKSFGWLMVFVTALFGANMSTTDLRGDSMNYAAISNNVLYNQDPLILTLNGELYMNKPPLFFWINALFIKFFGANAFSVKLSTLLAVLLIAYFLYRIAMELFDDENIAVMLPVLFFATYVVYKNTQMLKLEALVTAFMIGAVYFFIRYIREQSLTYVFLTGICSGLAVFVKGPLGFVPLIGIFLYPIMNREILSGRYYLHFIVIALVSVIIPGWWFGYVIANTPFYETFFLEQIVDRVGDNSINVTGTTYFQRPVWAYLLYMLKYGGYFVILFLYGFYRMRKDGKLSDQVKYILLAGAIYTVIIHFITTREHRYLYQFYLFFWIVGAYGLSCLLKKGFSSFVKYAAIVLMLFVVIYPGKMNWNTYTILQDAKKIADENNLPVVAQSQYISDISDKAAMTFFLRGSLKEPPAEGKWLEVVHKSKRLDGVELFLTRRIRVYIMGE